MKANDEKELFFFLSLFEGCLDRLGKRGDDFSDRREPPNEGPTSETRTSHIASLTKEVRAVLLQSAGNKFILKSLSKQCLHENKVQHLISLKIQTDNQTNHNHSFVYHQTGRLDLVETKEILMSLVVEHRPAGSVSGTTAHQLLRAFIRGSS